MKFIVPLFLLPFFSFSQIQFESSLDVAMKKAQKQDKLIFMDAYATWCQPCKVLEEYTFTDLEVANYFNKNFVNVRLDMEEYPGVELVEKYVVGAYPTLLFLNAKGEIVHRGCGAVDAAELLDLAASANSDSDNIMAYQKKYESGIFEVNDLLTYLEYQEMACLDAEKFANGILLDTPPAELGNEVNWALFTNYHWDIYSPYFQYLIDHQKIFYDLQGKESVDAKLYDVFLTQYQEVYLADDLHDFGMRALLNAINPLSFSGADTLKTMMNFHYAEVSENWPNYGTYGIEWVGMSGTEDFELINDIAWKFYLFIEDKNQLEIAKGWTKRMIDAYPEPSYIDTYASLLYKLGDEKKAIELEQKALELAVDLLEETSHYEYQLKKFKGE